MTQKKSRLFPVAFLAAKATLAALKLTNHEGGTLPGFIAEGIDPAFLGDIAKPEQIVFITGTNGKTTTNNLLNDLLADNGYQTVTNRVGGNISSGFASSFAKNATWKGTSKTKLAVMEFDELSGPRIFPYLQPDILSVTNLFRDTFSRSATPDYVFDVMDKGIPASTHLILNADDMISCRLAPQCTHRTYYSIARLAEDTAEPVGIVSDLTACPKCGGKLKWDYAHLRHLGHATCEECGYTNPTPDYEVISVELETGKFVVKEHCHEGAPTYEYKLNSYSIVNLYNLFVAIVTAREMGLAPATIAASLQRVNIASSRYNEIDYNGRRLISMASKGENDTATSVTIDILRKQPGDKAIIIMIADAYMAKAKDQTEYIGWYYQTDFEFLQDPSVKQVIIYGDTSLDLQLRLRLAGIDPAKTFVASSPEETADLVDLNACQHVFYAHGLYNGGIADISRNRIIERLKQMEASMSNPATKIEILYPEYGNQGGDNGNALYLEACLPKENFVYTSHVATPYFVEHTPSAIIMGGMTEAQQELVISRLMPYKDRLAELADQGVPMLFAGNASELFGEKIVNPDGSEIEALGLFKFTTTRYMPQRFHDVQVGEFDPGNGKEPFVVVGFKMQFTLTEGDNSNCYFLKNKVGFGINKESKLEGFRRKNAIATWLIGPLLPLNPYLTRWILDMAGEEDTPLAFEEEAVAAYQKHAREMVYPGMHLHY